MNCTFCHRPLLDCLCHVNLAPKAVVVEEPRVQTMKSPEVAALEDRMALLEKSLLSQVELNKIMMDRLAELEMRFLHEPVRYWPSWRSHEPVRMPEADAHE